jgi:hypothetical protein
MVIETEKKEIEGLRKKPLNRHGFFKNKPRSFNRIQNEAEMDSIKKQIGDLESIRERLGLSARKMTQLLLVDPSAWNRWTTKKTPPPPHIYRALQWYLALQEKNQGFTPQFFLATQTFAKSDSQRDLIVQLKQLEGHNQQGTERVIELEKRLEKHKRWIQVLILCIFALLVTQIALK